MNIDKWRVIKLNGETEAYDEAKVVDSIFLAAQDAGGTDRARSLELGQKVTEYLVEQFGRSKILSTRDVGDGVERILMREQHVRTARAFIINRDKKSEAYEAKIRLGIHDDLDMPLNSLLVMKNKYLQEKSTGEMETPGEAFDRVAKALIKAEKVELRAQWYQKFRKVMRERKMLPGGRTLANAGTINNQLANCFVMPFKDDIEEIFDVVRESSVLKKNGGGVGFSFGKIRPKGDEIKTTSGKACGPVALMTILDHASDIFLQAGRRSGNMVTLPVSHPDIFEFMSCKKSKQNLPHINYSINVTDEFMRAVEADGDWNLVNPRNNKIWQTVKARSIMEQAARLAWENGDPAVIFIDRINKDNPTPHVGALETVNLCGEQPLLSYEACNLGSVNIAAHLKPKKGKRSTVGDWEMDWDDLAQSVAVGVRMLDNVVSICKYPLSKVDKVVKGNRKIGLGVMGWGDALVRMGVAYDSDEAFQLARKMMKRIQKVAWETSEALGKEKGSFPNFKGSIWEKRGYKHFRNATTTTIAPTGSISMTAGCSYGVEPHFALAFYKKAMGSYELPEVNEDLVLALKRNNGLYSNELMMKVASTGSIQNVEEIPENLRKVFVTAMDISPEAHVRMLAAFQKYTDNAVSKTVNMTALASVADVMDVYMLAWKLGCKGITVYRDKSRSEQVLNVGSVKGQETVFRSQEPVSNSERRTASSGQRKQVSGLGSRDLDSGQGIGENEFCPECEGKISMVEGCMACESCGWGEV